MKRLVSAAVLLGLLTPLLARADLEKGDFAPDLDATDWINTDGKSISIAELRGMAVVLCFWESWQSTAEQLLPFINQLDNSGYGRGAGVFTLGVTSSDRRSAEDIVKKSRILFPIALGSKAAAAYKITQFPRLVVIDPTGTVAYSGWNSSGNSMVKEIEKVLETAPPFRTHPREAERAEKKLRAAQEALKKGDYHEALLKAREADEDALQDDRLKVRCQQMIDLVEAVGRDRLQAGLVLIDNHKIDEGIQEIRGVIEVFQVASCGKTARRRVRFLKEHYPEVQRAVDQAQREIKARAQLSEVSEKLWKHKFGEAYDKLKAIEKEFADTKAADIAKTIRERMDANRGLMQNVRNEEARVVCEDRLARARSYKTSGRNDEAKKLLRSIIDEFPNTRYEQEAYKLLSEMPL
jgi:tetratricopeptide (TPR) repeat protein